MIIIKKLENYLCNMLVTVTDRKLLVVDTISGQPYYRADISSVRDYYPFGMEMVGRGMELQQYRYCFNGQEQQFDYVFSSYMFQYRLYESKISRFISVDPLIDSFPGLTPYQFASNNPVEKIDLWGLQGISAQKLAYVGIDGQGMDEYVQMRRAEEEIMETEEFQCTVGIIAGTLMIVGLGPFGTMLGPTTIGLNSAKMIALLSGKGDREKIEKVPGTFTGVFVGAVTSAAGGDFQKGGAIGDLVEGIATTKVVVKELNLIEAGQVVTSVVNVSIATAKTLKIFMNNDEGNGQNNKNK